MGKYSFLKSDPETERDFFECIEGLGGFIFYSTHDIMHGRIMVQSIEDGLKEDIARAQETIEAVVNELCEKFDIVHPHKTKTEEEWYKIPYWVWYKGWKEFGVAPIKPNKQFEDSIPLVTEVIPKDTGENEVEVFEL